MIKYIFLFLMIFLNSVGLMSHPHAFIDASLKIEAMKEEKEIKMKIEWVFDEFFSSQLISEFDKNGNKKFDQDEIKKIEKSYFSYLKNFNYFMDIKINNKNQIFNVTDFKPEIIDDRLKYNFRVNLNYLFKKGETTIKISFFDKTYYTALSLAKEPLISTNLTIVKNEILPNRFEFISKFLKN